MKQLVLIRHGESKWNLENRFTGWADIDLTKTGIQQAINAGKKMKEYGYHFDIAYTSFLKRAIRTLWHIKEEMDLLWIPTICNWRLNERHYGSLIGLNKEETLKKYGKEQVLLWRRSYEICPPLLDKRDPRTSYEDRKYASLKKEEIPLGESLKDNIMRVLPLWEDSIVPALKADRKILISAHGNSIRSLIKHLDKINDQDIINIDIPNGMPLVYELDDNLYPIRHFYLD